MKRIAALTFALCAAALPMRAESAPSPPSSDAPPDSSAGIYKYGISIGLSKPAKDFVSGNIVGGSYWDAYFGVSLSLDNGNAWPTILMVQIDYYNLDKTSFLASLGYGRQLTPVFGLYGGAGVGFSIAAESFADIFTKKDTLALKAFVGARFLAGQVILRADISYHVDTGKPSGYRDSFGGLIVPAIFAGWLL